MDELLLVDDGGLGAPRTRYRQRRVGPGGMTSTALAQAAALGCEAHLLSLVGRDADGRRVLRDLRALDVCTRRVVRSEHLPTTRAVVLVDRRSGERRFVLPDRSRIESQAPDFDLSGLRRGSVLLVDGHFPAQALRAVRRARERGVPVIGDFADARPAYRRLLPWVDYPIVPLDFVAQWGAGGPAETLRALHVRFGGTPVVTLGASGALAWLDARPRRVAAPRVRVVDTTGAGDAFHGAFAAGLCRGLGLLDALRLATRAGAECCRGLGGTASLLRQG